MVEPKLVIYWDASAVLSLLFSDTHSDTARAWMAKKGAVHLLSSLAQAECGAVIARLGRERILTEAMTAAAWDNLSGWPWRWSGAQPDGRQLMPLAGRWPLRGADLWHLACAKALSSQLPELHLLTFDQRLHAAAAGEGLLRKR